MSTSPTPPAGTGSDFEVVTFGEPMILLLAAGDLPLPVAQQFDASIAGAESNLATGLARLGHRVAYFGRVGADAFGERIRRGLRAENVDVSRLDTDPELPTGMMIRDNPVGRPITVDYRRSGSAATRLAPDTLPTELLRCTRVLHVTGITAALSESSLDATERAMVIAAEAGATVSFDPNLRLRLADPQRWQMIIKRLAPHAGIVFTGRDEAEVIAPGVPAETWFADHGADTVVIKDGASGSTEHLIGSTVPAVHGAIRTVDLIDPVGAGDAFNAGWLSAWLGGADGRTEADARIRLQTAAAVASLVVTTRGDAAGLPDRATLVQVTDGAADVIR